jgi:hypothetical protein
MWSKSLWSKYRVHAPASYFNLLLARIAEEFGVGAITNRICFKWESAAQEFVFKRSLLAVQMSQLR